jgi:hypothetical protein
MRNLWPVSLLMVLSACPSGPTAEGEGESSEGEGESSEGEGESSEGEGEEPGLAVVAELNWDTATAGVTIHVTKRDANGLFCVVGLGAGPRLSSCDVAPLDCNATSCTASWDGVVQVSRGDPELTAGEFGLGPDRIVVQALTEGEYLFSAYRYDDAAGDVQLSGRLFLGGQLDSEQQPFVSANTWTEFSIVIVRTDGTSCVENLSDGDDTDDCGP